MSYPVEDERTHAEKISPDFDRPAEDVSLLVLSGPDVGRRFLIKPPGGIIGREMGAAVQLRDPKVSGRHALIEFSDGRVMLSDMGSKNGVFVNNVHVKRAEIYDGNNIQVSNDTIMRARFQDPAETELLEKMQGESTRDHATGLANRRYILQRLQQELCYAYRHGEPVSIALVDVDDFQKVIDVDGQEGGNQLLRGLAEEFRQQTRYEDVVGRYGHDELAVVFRNTGPEQALVFANRMLERIRNRSFDTGDVPIRASVTIGLTTFAERAPGKQDNDDAPDRLAKDAHKNLIDQADQAVFRGKTAGKDRAMAWTKNE
ncbi:MAG: GGDEF domain-containing protein [Myxococcota bacterium]